MKGLERERKENSGHSLFLVADRSVLQSKKLELRTMLCKIQEFKSLTPVVLA